MYVCMYVCVYVCMYVRTYVLYMYVRMYVLYMYVRTYVCMYVHSAAAATLSHSRAQSPPTTPTLSAESRQLFPQHNALSRFERIRRFTGNDHSVLNEHQPTADRRWSSGIGVERVPNYYTWWIFQNHLRNEKRIVFGMWNVGSRYRSGSLGTAASE